MTDHGHRNGADGAAIGQVPAKLWKQLEAKARPGLSLRSALRAAILEWAKRAP